MIQTITKEWEITKTYIFDVALKDALINLDWNDFQTMARNHKVAMAVQCDEPLSIGEQMSKALEEMSKTKTGKLTGFIVTISFKPGKDLMMDELGSVSECFDRLGDENQEIIWGVQPNDSIENDRSVTIYAFEQL